MCSYDPDNTCEVWHESRPVARKQHTCSDCGRTIDPGEAYLRVRYIYEGEPGGAKVCAHCQAAARWLVVVCSGYAIGEALWDLADHLREYEHGQAPRSSHLTRLVRLGGRRWQHRDGTLIPVDEVQAIAQAAIDRVPVEMRGAA